jgi:C-terminal processing protease CtpA/Prc
VLVTTGQGAVVVAVVAALASGCTRRERVEPFPDSFVGVGIELRMEGETPVVVRSLDGGASGASGLQEGDRIVAVNGESTAGKSLGDVVMSLRGAPESQVSITADRAGQRIIFVLHRRGMSKRGADYSPARN